VLALLALGYHVDYLRIPEITARKKGQSGIHPVKDFLRFVKIMLRITVLYGPSKIFLPFALFLFVLGAAHMGVTIYFQNTIQELGVVAMILAFVVAGFAVLGEQLARIRIEIGVAVENEIAEHNSTFHTSSARIHGGIPRDDTSNDSK
jgi:hypothetical protein